MGLPKACESAHGRFKAFSRMMLTADILEIKVAGKFSHC
jgi:hypothetical protein